MIVSTINEHYELLPTLISESVETLVHFDSHLDYGFIEPKVLEMLKKVNVNDLHEYRELPFIIDQKGYNIGNFLYAAHHLGNLKTIIWILPNCLELKKDGLRAVSQLQNVEMLSFMEAKRCQSTIKIMVQNLQLIIVPYEQLNETLLSAFVSTNTLLDIDMDFLINYETGEQWLTEKALFDKLVSIKAFDNIARCSICSSIESGYSPLQMHIEMEALSNRVGELMKIRPHYSDRNSFDQSVQNILFLTNVKNVDQRKLVYGLTKISSKTTAQMYYDEVFVRLLANTGSAEDVLPFLENRLKSKANMYSDGLNILKMYIKFKQVPCQIEWLDDWAALWDFWIIDYYVGMIYLHQKKHIKAESYLKRSQLRNPVNKRIYGALAMLYKETQNTEGLRDAIRAYSLVE